MSYRSPDTSSEFFLLTGSVGDVLAARSVAMELLRNVKLQPDDTLHATLILTAALLDCASRDDEGVTPWALGAYLEALSLAVPPGSIMSQCRLQFVRYAALEFSGFSRRQRVGVVQTLRQAVSLAGLDGT